MLKYMNEFDCKKSSGVKVPPKVIKLAKEEIIIPISSCLNNCISSNVFLNEYIFKAPGIVPVLRKQCSNDKTNYRPIGLFITNYFKDI